MTSISTRSNSYISKEGTTFHLEWNKNLTDNEAQTLALSAFSKSYQENSAFKSVTDCQIKDIVSDVIKKYPWPSTGYVITARQSGKLAGYAAFIKQDPTTVNLAWMMTCPEYWGKGLGTRLIYSIRQKEPKINKITLFCDTINTRTVHFYRSKGFIAVKEDSGLITFEKRL